MALLPGKHPGPGVKTVPDRGEYNELVTRRDDRAAAPCSGRFDACCADPGFGGCHTVKEGLDDCFATRLEAVVGTGQWYTQAYAAALDEREAILADPEVTNAVSRLLMEEERWRSSFFSDVTGLENRGLKEYYGEESVYVEEPRQQHHNE